MERIGKYFEFGYPNLTRGIEYNWPNQDLNFGRLITQRKDDLGEFLLERTRGYMKDFSRMDICGPYPYLQKGVEGLALHTGDGGRWIEVWKTIGAGFLGTHNLDSYIDRAIAFNIGSDTIEFLDLTILTPRVSKQGENYVIRYPLPEGLEVIPADSRYTKENLQRLFSLNGLDSDLQLTMNETQQEIKTSQGVISVSRGICEVRSFEGWNLTKASWIASMLMSLCKQG